MNRLRHQIGILAATMGLSLLFVGSSTGQVTTDGSTNVALRTLPQLKAHRSPVEFFRKLLAMTPEGREKAIADRPSGIRQRIEAKLNEYEALPASERELRLRATELHWYLRPLMNIPRDQRGERLALIPEDMRQLVESRLDGWDILPPELKTELLDNEMAVRYFTQPESVRTDFPVASPPHRQRLDESLKRWQALSDQQRQSAEFRFNLFFELTPEEKQQTLASFPESEQQQMEKTLQAFENMPRDQRAVCVQAFNKFAGMSEVERQQFVANAEHWKQMSPEERQQWRDLVAQVPAWPPLPAGYLPASTTNIN